MSDLGDLERQRAELYEQMLENQARIIALARQGEAITAAVLDAVRGRFDG